MLAEFASWWVARMRELLPSRAGSDHGIIVHADPDGSLTGELRRKGRCETVPLGAVSRLAGRRPVRLCPPPHLVLRKQHVVPTVSRADTDQMLRLELGRITPFAPETVWWRWDGRPLPQDRTRTEVQLTLVPKAALAPMLATLNRVGIHPAELQVGDDPARILSLIHQPGGTRREMLVRGGVMAAAVLAVIAVALPFALQAWAASGTQAAMEALRPDVTRVETLRRGITASAAGSDIVARERARIGDVPAVLAAVTRVLPDDSYLTDFSLRQRQLSFSGRSASAPNLIGLLAVDPAFRNAAFAAPVTRIEGTKLEVFSIRAEVAPEGSPQAGSQAASQATP